MFCGVDFAAQQIIQGVNGAVSGEVGLRLEKYFFGRGLHFFSGRILFIIKIY